MKFNFFNPKFGATWMISPDQQAYASVSVAHREPTRNNYEESFSAHAPRAERLVDYEAGYRYNGSKFEVSAGLYWMQYKDQFVLNGTSTKSVKPFPRMSPTATAPVSNWPVHGSPVRCSAGTPM